jgi:oxygen-independent coproporphyrinogen-3 oxidase
MDITLENKPNDLTSSPISESLLQKFDVSGPRYTSYPTADRFVEAFTETAYKEALEQRRVRSINQPLSINFRCY